MDGTGIPLRARGESAGEGAGMPAQPKPGAAAALRSATGVGREHAAGWCWEEGLQAASPSVARARLSMCCLPASQPSLFLEPAYLPAASAYQLSPKSGLVMHDFPVSAHCSRAPCSVQRAGVLVSCMVHSWQQQMEGWVEHSGSPPGGMHVTSLGWSACWQRGLIFKWGRRQEAGRLQEASSEQNTAHMVQCILPSLVVHINCL